MHLAKPNKLGALLCLAAVVGLLTVSGCKESGGEEKVVAPPTHVGAASLYPDANLTPGDTIPGVTAADVCRPGYARSVRHVSGSTKAEVYRLYGERNVRGAHEVDHFISLELGGSNDVKNLWPEPYEPRPGAHEKDKVENWLHEQVCNGNMTLPEAQYEIRTDWYKVYLKIENQ